MGGLVEDIFGGGDTETTVTYNLPPSASALQNILTEEIQALRPLATEAAPSIENILAELINQYTQWYQQAPQIYEDALRRQQELTQEMVQKAKEAGHEVREEVKRVGEDVLQDALRDTIRQLAASGLISQSAGTQAMSEQFKRYMFEPQVNLLGLEAKNIADMIKAGYLQESGLLGKRLAFEQERPQFLRDIASLKQQKALTPFELRRSLLGTLSGIAPTMMQLSPANVTQTASGGIDPIFGGLLGTAGSLGLFKLFGII